MALQDAGTFDAVLRYEDLCSHREVAVKSVLAACGNNDAIGLEDASYVLFLLVVGGGGVSARLASPDQNPRLLPSPCRPCFFFPSPPFLGGGWTC